MRNVTIQSGGEPTTIDARALGALLLAGFLVTFFFFPARTPTQAAESRRSYPGLSKLPVRSYADHGPAPDNHDTASNAAFRPRQSTSRGGATAVGPIVINVSDLDRSLDFYSRVLSFRKISETEVKGADYEHLEGVFGLNLRVARMQLGGDSIELTEYLTPKGRPIPAESRSNDRWFQHIAIITSNMDRAYKRLRENRVEYASNEPQTLPAWNNNAGGIRAFYFKDPDEHVLEVLQFPPDKGRARWHTVTQDLFLGIDHTAIVTGDTEASLKFYRDTLGLKVVGTSENYGTEQEHLNNVFGARLRITSLRAEDGPGVELLEYLAPRDGKSIAPETRTNDLVRWQTTIEIEHLESEAQRLERAGYKLASAGVVVTSGAQLGFAKSCLALDPDGHLIRLIERQSPRGDR